MYWVSFISLILSGAALSFQDFKSRLLSLWLVLLFGAASVLVYLHASTRSQLLENILFCMTYLLFSYLVLVLYFYMKHRRLEAIMDTKVGWGDALIFLCIGACLEPEVVIFFFTSTLIISLIPGLLLSQRGKSIPLAGIAVISYLAYLFIKMV